MKTNNTAAFKAYDIRGRLPDELNVDLAYRIGRAYAEFLQPARVVVFKSAGNGVGGCGKGSAHSH